MSRHCALVFGFCLFKKNKRKRKIRCWCSKPFKALCLFVFSWLFVWILFAQTNSKVFVPQPLFSVAVMSLQCTVSFCNPMSQAVSFSNEWNAISKRLNNQCATIEIFFLPENTWYFVILFTIYMKVKQCRFVNVWASHHKIIFCAHEERIYSLIYSLSAPPYDNFLPMQRGFIVFWKFERWWHCIGGIAMEGHHSNAAFRSQAVGCTLHLEQSWKSSFIQFWNISCRLSLLSHIQISWDFLLQTGGSCPKN